MAESIVKLSTKDSAIILEVNGNIDELFSFQNVNFSGYKELIFDLQHLIAINSIGIRTWIQWNATIPKNIKIIYRNCSRVAVEHMQTFAGFYPSGTFVESAYVPYYCDPCDKATDLLVRATDSNTSGTVDIPDTIECQYCHNPATIDADKDDYTQVFLAK